MPMRTGWIALTVEAAQLVAGDIITRWRDQNATPADWVIWPVSRVSEGENGKIVALCGGLWEADNLHGDIRQEPIARDTSRTAEFGPDELVEIIRPVEDHNEDYLAMLSFVATEWPRD